MSNDTQLATKPAPNAIQVPPTPEAQAFALIQRQASMLSNSTLVPKEFQGNISNCAIALEIANRLKCSAFMVMQNIDIIHGRPSFRATFLIAMVNSCGRFTHLMFKMEGEKENRSCVAYTKVLSTGEAIEGPMITMAMAKAEGWSTKSGSKWITMPELMLRYRAAAFFARLHASDITLGMSTTDEMQDMGEARDVTPIPSATTSPLFAKVKTEPPALVLSDDAPSPRETFLAKVQALGVPWSELQQALLDNGIIEQKCEGADLVEDHEMDSILATWPNLEKMMKGGAK